MSKRVKMIVIKTSKKSDFASLLTEEGFINSKTLDLHMEKIIQESSTVLK